MEIEDEEANATKTGLVVLVVEDEFLIREMVVYELRLLGWTVIEARHASEALSILESGAVVSLLFSDIRMPGKIDGVALVRIVHERFPKVRCVLASAYPPPELSAGLQGHFLSKPYVVDDVDAALREAASRPC